MNNLYNIYHVCDVYGNAGGPTQQIKSIGLVETSPEEIEKYLEYWNRPRVYYDMYDKMYEHRVIAVEVQLKPLDTLIPYNPETREWPDLPHGMYMWMQWDAEKKEWIE